MRPDGTREPNGVDFWWDALPGSGNCWQGNTGPGRQADDARRAPDLLGGPGSSFATGNPAKQTSWPCATWP